MKIKASVLKNFLNNYELAPGGIFGKKISKIRYNDKDELKLQFIKNYENGRVMPNFKSNSCRKISDRDAKVIIGISAFANEKPFADINELFFNNNLTLENLKCEKGNTENGCLSLGRERLCYIEDGEEKKCNTTNCPIYILFYKLTKSVTEEKNDNEQQRKEIISDLRVFLKEFIGEDKAKDLIGGKSKNKCEDICDNLYDLAKKYINPFERYNKVHDKNYYKYHEICLNAYNKLCIDTYKLLYYTSALMKACDYDETKCVRMECNKITAFIRVSLIPFVSYECKESFHDVIESCENLIEKCEQPINKYELSVELFELLVRIMCHTNMYDKKIKEKIINNAKRFINLEGELNVKNLEGELNVNPYSEDRFRKLRIKKSLNFLQLRYCSSRPKVEIVPLVSKIENACFGELKRYHPDVEKYDFSFIYFWLVFIENYSFKLKYSEQECYEIGSPLNPITYDYKHNEYCIGRINDNQTDSVNSHCIDNLSECYKFETFVDCSLNDPIALFKEIYEFFQIINNPKTDENEQISDLVCKTEKD